MSAADRIVWVDMNLAVQIIVNEQNRSQLASVGQIVADETVRLGQPELRSVAKGAHEPRGAALIHHRVLSHIRVPRFGHGEARALQRPGFVQKLFGLVKHLSATLVIVRALPLARQRIRPVIRVEQGPPPSVGRVQSEPRVVDRAD